MRTTPTSTELMQDIVKDINSTIILAIFNGQLDTTTSHYVALDTARCVLLEAITGGTPESFERVVLKRLRAWETT